MNKVTKEMNFVFGQQLVQMNIKNHIKARKKKTILIFKWVEISKNL